MKAVGHGDGTGVDCEGIYDFVAEAVLAKEQAISKVLSQSWSFSVLTVTDTVCQRSGQKQHL